MNTLSYKTVSVNKATAQKEWVLIDAQDLVLGRMASKIAKLLRGKYKPSFTPHVDCGDNVIVVNADKVRLTGKKWTDRVYLRHSLYPGGQKASTPQEMMEKSPEKLVRKVVKGMLPKNILADRLINNLYVYAGSEHPHAAQEPKLIDLNKIK